MRHDDQLRIPAFANTRPTEAPWPTFLPGDRQTASKVVSVPAKTPVGMAQTIMILALLSICLILVIALMQVTG